MKVVTLSCEVGRNVRGEVDITNVVLPLGTVRVVVGPGDRLDLVADRIVKEMAGVLAGKVDHPDTLTATLSARFAINVGQALA